jgi:hypothetical protein
VHAHLRPDLFRESDFKLLDVDLMTGPAPVLELRPKAEEAANGCTLVTDASSDEKAVSVNSQCLHILRP